MRNKQVVVHLYGGIGNQLFQYTFGEYLRYKHQLNVFYDISSFGVLATFRELQINSITDEIPIFKTGHFFFSRYTKYLRIVLKVLFCMKRGYKYFYNGIDESILTADNWKVIYFDGYWQDKKYAEWIISNVGNIYLSIDKIPVEFEKYIHFVKKHNVTSIHIRRGDYLKKENINLLGICSLKYYTDSVEYILSKDPSTEIIVISDDNEWVRKNLRLSKNYIIVEELNIKPFWYIYLMSQCNNNIMSNSTFSWWGAFLNNHNEKIIVAPMHWMKQKENPPIYTDTWKLIDNWK